MKVKKSPSKESTKVTCQEKKGGKIAKNNTKRVKCPGLTKISRSQEIVLAEVAVELRNSVSRLTVQVSFLPIFRPRCVRAEKMAKGTLNQNG